MPAREFPAAYSRASAQLVLANMASRLMEAADELKDAARTGEARDPLAAALIAARLERAALDMRASEGHAFDCRA